MRVGGVVALVLDWQKKLGYRKDPFRQDILRPLSHFIVGTTGLQERFNLFLIKGEQYGTITGVPGSGKTTFLSWIHEQLAKSKQYIPQYLDAEKAKSRANLTQQLLLGSLGFLGKRLAKKKSQAKQEAMLKKRLAKKRPILLIDNAGMLEDDALSLLKDILGWQAIVVLSDTEKSIKGLDAPDKLKLTMPSYSTEELADLIRGRIEAAGGSGLFPFSDEEIQRLVREAEYNPRELLRLARERAIELSLKVTQQPRPQEKPRRFLSIRIAKENEAPLIKREDAPPSLPEEALLGNIVAAPQAREQIDNEDLIRELERHLSPEEKPAKKAKKKKTKRK